MSEKYESPIQALEQAAERGRQAIQDAAGPATFDPLTRTWSGPMPEPTSTALYSQMCVPHEYVGDRPCPECAADVEWLNTKLQERPVSPAAKVAMITDRDRIAFLRTLLSAYRRQNQADIALLEQQWSEWELHAWRAKHEMSATADPDRCHEGTHQGFCDHCGRCQCGDASVPMKRMP